MSEDKRKKAERNYQKQRDMIMDTMIRIAGKSLEQAVKDTFFRERLMNQHQYRYAIAMGDNPIADFMIAKLDHERALIDMREYEAMINATHAAVKNEVKKAAEEAIDELTKDFK